MTIDPNAVRTALDSLGPGSAVDVSAESTGLLRYAHSKVVAQHSERRLRVRVRLTRGGRTVCGTLETLDPAAVRALGEHLAEALPPGAPDEQAPEPDSQTATEDTSPTVLGESGRHEWFELVRKGLGDDVSLGGSVRDDDVERVIADHSGLFRAEHLTRAAIHAVAAKDGRSVSIRRMHRDPKQVDVEGIPDELLGELAPLPVCEPVHGPFRAVLRPQAADALVATFGYAVFGAAGYARGTTAVAGRMGDQLVSELLTLTDDGHDPAGLPSAFDAEGVVRRRTPLIERGRVAGVVSNREFAHVTGGRSTGHGVPFGWRFGALPSPSHLLLAAGDATDDDLLAACGDGLVVSRLDYLRVLHPKDTLVTGTTRDGTYLVKGGQIVAVHPPVRLTFRMDEVLRAVRAVGARREIGDAPFIESVVAPGLVVESGPLRA